MCNQKNDKTSDVQGQSSVEIIRERYVILLSTDEMKSQQLAFSCYEISERYFAGRLKGHSHFCKNINRFYIFDKSKSPLFF